MKRKKTLKSHVREVENGGKFGGRSEKRRRATVGSSVDVDPKSPKNRKEAEREALDAEELP